MVSNKQNSKKFDLNLLRVFVSTYETQSVTKSAEELDLTQSSVSNALSRLKGALGSELFTRTGRGIKPTRFAVDLYEHIHEHLLGIDRVVEGLDSFDPLTSRRSFVIYCHEAALLRLQKQLHVLEKYPGIALILKELPPNDARIYEDLRLEKVDLVIDVAPPDGRVFQSQLLHSDGLVCIASQHHPRLKNGQMTKQVYMEESHALLNIRRDNLTFVEWLVSDILPPRRTHSQHSSLLGMLPSISQSHAIATVPETLFEEYGEMFHLQVLPFPFETKTFDTYMVWPSKMARNSALTWVQHLVKSLLEKRHS
ncbi:chromosome initiation inhibitor [Vibrio maritimus]|uniref:Chromosome initiation inhibitor n=1 Tax=Vibrio maritimus TaxID=990268 RepID=A0A090T9U0_9VIBR|nr:chromosome initiation inhibitor [Vibrio maritimus]